MYLYSIENIEKYNWSILSVEKMNIVYVENILCRLDIATAQDKKLPTFTIQRQIMHRIYLSNSVLDHRLIVFLSCLLKTDEILMFKFFTSLPQSWPCCPLWGCKHVVTENPRLSPVPTYQWVHCVNHTSSSQLSFNQTFCTIQHRLRGT